MIREGCTIYDININNEEDYVVLLNYDSEEETAQGYVKYRVVNDNPLKVALSEIWIDDELKSTSLKKMIQYAVEQVYDIGGEIIAGCKEVEDFMRKMEEEQQEIEKKKYLREIEPQGNDGSKKLIVDSEYSFIEYPVREAVRRMNESGMKTIMSSSNKDDVEGCGKEENTLSEHIFIWKNSHFSIGNGYAWIMIDYESLSEELKQRVIELNRGDIEVTISDKTKEYFNTNCTANGCKQTQGELIKFYRVLQKHPNEVSELFPQIEDEMTKLEDEIAKLEIEKKKFEEETRGKKRIIWGRLKEFREKHRKLDEYRKEKARHDQLSDEDKYFEDNMTSLYHENSLGYNGVDYKAVVFRYPVGEETTVEEVQQYYQELLNLLLKERNKNTNKTQTDAFSIDYRKNTQELGIETIPELKDTKFMDETEATMETTINEKKEKTGESQDK